jgi:hypothetical protein
MHGDSADGRLEFGQVLVSKGFQADVRAERVKRTLACLCSRQRKMSDWKTEQKAVAIKNNDH